MIRSGPKGLEHRKPPPGGDGLLLNKPKVRRKDILSSVSMKGNTCKVLSLIS